MVAKHAELNSLPVIMLASKTIPVRWLRSLCLSGNCLETHLCLPSHYKFLISIISVKRGGFGRKWDLWARVITCVGNDTVKLWLVIRLELVNHLLIRLRPLFLQARAPPHPDTVLPLFAERVLPFSIEEHTVVGQYYVFFQWLGKLCAVLL